MKIIFKNISQIYLWLLLSEKTYFNLNFEHEMKYFRCN